MAEKNYRVQALPPTLGIKDPDVRNFLDALVNAWDHRSGNTDSESPDRFITSGEFKGMATKALVEALGSSLPGATGAGLGAGGGSSEVAPVIESISDYIKRSILYQILGTEYPTIDISGLSAKIDAAFGDARTLVLQESEQRSSEYEAMTSTISAQASRITAAEAAIVSEASTRVNKDNALASAINNMWAKIGGSSAVIQDGQLASVTPSAAQATKWDQVQVAVTDPNTGLPSSTSIKQELTSYANAADGTLNSIYSVRAQVVSGGRTIVGGFGLAATNGAGSSEGPRIAFGVRADEFWVGSLSGVGDIPFTILTSPTTINGVSRPAGVYIKDAFIANGTIDSAKIGIAQVDTLRVAGGAVTTMSYGSGGVAGVPASGQVEVCRCYINMPSGSSGVVLVANATAGPTSTAEATGYLTIRRQDGTQIGFTAFSMVSSSQFSASCTGFDPNPITGTSWYALYASNPATGPGGNRGVTVQTSAITATGGKR